MIDPGELSDLFLRRIDSEFVCSLNHGGILQ